MLNIVYAIKKFKDKEGKNRCMLQTHNTKSAISAHKKLELHKDIFF